MLKYISLSVLAAIFISGCSSPVAAYKVDGQFTSSYLTDADNQRDDDAKLAERLNSDLHEQIAQSKVRVMANNFNVLLVGQVVTAADKVRAEKLCHELPVVKKVFNYLTVAAKPELKLNNSISNQVMDRIELQNDVNSRSIDVITVNGTVYVMGTNVGNLTALREALDASYAIDGVNKVINLEQRGRQDYQISK